MEKVEDVVTFERIKEIIERDGLENSTGKTIRNALEECAGLKPGDLKSRKADQEGVDPYFFSFLNHCMCIQNRAFVCDVTRPE